MTPILGETLAVLLIGSTHYVDIGQRQDAAIYYATDREVYMSLPGKQTMVGTLDLNERGYFVDWTNGPEGQWQITHAPGEFEYIGPDGEAAGTITSIVPGDPEQFGG